MGGRQRHQPKRRGTLQRPAQLNYPGDLPVVQRRDEILRALREHQVIVVAGETGSGKTTQLPKICLEAGRGIEGMIGHTQPRRIAARSVAERISAELGVDLGTTVGYQVRFTDRSSRDSLVKVMTDGILLAELQRDHDLRRYDTLIIDEAHERSLNIDFILGYLRQLLPRRPDLKVIITSATIDVDRFAAHFAGADGDPAPVVEVSGRTYPVQVRYRPLVRPGPPSPDGTETSVDIDQVTGVIDAVEELWTEDAGVGPADILVFCSGEREIRDTADALSGLNLPATEVLPLYGRLSGAEQHRVFGSHSGRRIVVATNVAETSLTVPGIRYVIDAGTARISRYSARLKVQRLPIEPISQASANQRSGRCGRLGPGIAIRLYSEEDFLARPEFTDPEILRTNLASVILQMTALGLGEVARFGFLDPPDARQVTDATRLLTELQAIDPQAPAHLPKRRLTAYGRAIAALPVDPRLARMLIEAERNGALREVLVIVAALSIQDPRERPEENRTQADQAHARFRNGTEGVETDSDFTVLLNLWRYLRRQQRDLSGSAFRRMCRREYLHYLRVREWQDLHAQLRQACREVGLQSHARGAEEGAESGDSGSRKSGSGKSGAEDAVHQSLLAGLLSLVGLRDQDTRDYLGARGARFHLQPGSALFRANPDWVMTAELVETSRLWARVNARTDPAWVERAAAHLVKRSYSEPRWSRKRAGAVANERVTLYGIPLAAGRPVPLGRVDPQTARDLFIRHALVEGDWETRHDFFHANRRLIQELGDLEARARRRDILVDDETLVEFYDSLIPDEVVSGAHFDSWWKKARKADPELLTFTEELLVRAGADAVDDSDYPGSWRQGDLEFTVTYQFEPGSGSDGVTVHLPIEVLNQVSPAGFDWQVPGLREELVTALVKSLPKATRRHFVPAPDHARQAMAAIGGPERSAARETLVEALAAELSSRRVVPVAPGDFDLSRVPDHLRITFSVERRVARKGGGRRRVEVLGTGKDLAELQARLAPRVRTTMAAAAASIEATGIRTWEPIGELPQVFEQQVAGRPVVGYPALVDTGQAVDIRVLATRAEADRATASGVRRLLLLNSVPPWKRVLALLDTEQKLALGYNRHGSVPALLDDVLAAVVDSVVAEQPGGLVRSASAFETALTAVRQQSVPRVIEAIEAIAPALVLARSIEASLERLVSPVAAALVNDVRAQLDTLISDGFVVRTGLRRLPHLLRYLRAIEVRLDKGPQDLGKDAARMEQVHHVEREYHDFVHDLPEHRRGAADVVDIGWQLQELRVSLFAQRLGTPSPVSEKRIYAAMDKAEQA